MKPSSKGFGIGIGNIQFMLEHLMEESTKGIENMNIIILGKAFASLGFL